MMHVLLESGPRRAPRGSRWTAASFATHGLIIAAAVLLTATVSDAPIEIERIVEVIPWRPDPPPAPAPSMPLGSIPRPGPVAIPAIDVPQIRFPDYLPAIETSADFPVSRIFGDPRGTSPHPADSGDPLTSDQVEQIVRPRIGNPSPAYPSMLRSAGVEGDVLVRFVVDTLGRVEPRSIEIREANHVLFADAVRDWIGRTRYDPATFRGQRVRQLVEQRVGFSLKR